MDERYRKWIDEWLLENDPHSRALKATLQMQKAFPELTRVQGHVDIVYSERAEEHWWLIDSDGEIIDPTASQYSKIVGYYEWGPGDDLYECINCGAPSKIGFFCCARCYDEFEESCLDWEPVMDRIRHLGKCQNCGCEVMQGMYYCDRCCDQMELCAEKGGEVDLVGIDSLIKALGSEETCEQAKGELIALGKPAVIPLLEKLDDCIGFRKQVVDVLIGIGKPAIRPIICSFRDIDEDAHWSNGSIRWDLIDALAGIGEPAFGIVIGLLDSERPYLRAGAARVLGRMGNRRVVGSLCRVLMEDPAGGPRAAAAQALGDIGDPVCVDILIRALNDEDRLVRLYSVTSLGQIKDDRAVEPLIRQLKDNYRIKAEAARILGMFGDERALPDLIWALGCRGSGYSSLRGVICEAVLSFESERTVKLLIKFFNKGNERLRKKVAWVLGRMEELSLEPVLMALEDEDPDTRRYAVRALGWMEDDRIEDHLRPLAGEDGDVGEEARIGLERIRERNEPEDLDCWDSYFHNECLNCGSTICVFGNFCSKECEREFLEDLDRDGRMWERKRKEEGLKMGKKAMLETGPEDVRAGVRGYFSHLFEGSFLCA